jgi:O-antigen ligase
VDAEGSALQRYEIWKVARAIIAENPVMGVGLGGYPQAHREFATRRQFAITARGARDTHSTYLNVAAETGLVGAVIWFVTYIAALLEINRVRKRAKKVLPATSQQLFVYLAGTAGFFVCAVFGSMAHVSFLILHVTLMWSIAEMMRQELDAVKKGTLVVVQPEPRAARRRKAR